MTALLALTLSMGVTPPPAPPSWNWAVVVIPAAIALLGTLVTAYLLRRSHSEDTEVNSFKAISDALFKRIENLELEVKGLKEERANDAARLEQYREENENYKRQNGALGRYVRKLLRIIAEHAPNVDAKALEPDEPIT